MIAIDGQSSDTVYVKQSTDSLFRSVAGQYVFARTSKVTYYVPFWRLSSNLNNTSDAAKPISTATQTALDLKANQSSISNINNTSDANKPVSTAQATAIALKSTVYFGIDAGANDSYVITASPVPASYTAGMMVMFKANTANTTGCTINVNSLGVKNIVKRVSTTPATGDILALMFCWLVYDGTNFVILNPVVN
jgi:hypothetical protein